MTIWLLLSGLSAAETPFPTDAAAIVERNPAGKVGDIELTAVRTSHGTEGEEHFACERFAWWVERKQGTAVTRSKLVEYCNDGYGASGVGEDSVEVGDNRFTYSKMGGSAWRWDTSQTVQLEPLMVLTHGGSSFHTAMLDVASVSWNHQAFTGTVRDTFGLCGQEDSMKTVDHVVAAIPQVTSLDQGARLGSCALSIDSKTGPFAHGAAGEAGDATLAVVATGPQQLFVELTDDTWKEGSTSSWIFDDHVELWVSYDSDFQPACEMGAVQYGVLLDGTVHPAHGEPAQKLTATVLDRGPEHVRLQLDLAARPTRVTLVYSDSDDGKSQERLIATSVVKRGKATSLGRVVTSWQACKNLEGVLVPQPVPIGEAAITER